MASDARRTELVALFEAHGALADPTLLVELADAPDGPVRVQAVLAGLQEVPFHFDRELWQRLEERSRERATAPVPAAPTLDPASDRERARKEALRRAAIAIYDGKADAADGDGSGDGGVNQGGDLGGAAGDADEGQEGGAGGASGFALGGDSDPDALDAVEHLDVPEAAPDSWMPGGRVRIEPRGDWRPLAKDHVGRLEVVQDMTGNSTCEGTTQDFVTYFQDRHKQIGKMLRSRRELRNAIPIERLKAGAREAQVIGMVVEKHTAKSGNLVLEVEDETGPIRALVKADDQALFTLANTLLHDEVVGLVGQVSSKGDLLFVEQLVRPDIPRPDSDVKRGADVPLMAAFVSDVHVGSKTHMQENWRTMLRWLCGHADSKRERDAAGRVKYLVIPGDLVDGVGIYPGQQQELSIGDIYDQYGAFAADLENIPEHIEIIIQPGNHDASRPAEPQPAFPKEVRSRFDSRSAKFVANPAWFRMHGALTLGYHGFSLIDFAASIPGLEYEKPLPTMKQMLQCRHLAPLYGERTPVAPEHKDYLVVSEVPDIFVTGHVHVPGLDPYRGVLMVNSGTWQSQTAYQRMLNFTPDPCRMPIVDLQTLRGTLVDFQGPRALPPATA